MCAKRRPFLYYLFHGTYEPKNRPTKLIKKIVMNLLTYCYHSLEFEIITISRMITSTVWLATLPENKRNSEN